MDVTNASWQQVGDATPTSLVVQNVGTPRIAFIFAADQTAADAVTGLEDGSHGILHPGSDPMTVTDLATNSKSMFAKALGPINGKLFVDSNV